MNKKILIITGFFFLFVIFILFLIISNKPKTNIEDNKTNFSPYQKIKINNNEKINPNPTNPPIISPQDFTGVKEEELPKNLKEYSDQKLDLLKRLPFKTPHFNIDFDYVEDKFTVSYNDPKSTSKNMFSLWLSQNYPALKIEDFLEK